MLRQYAARPVKVCVDCHNQIPCFPKTELQKKRDVILSGGEAGARDHTTVCSSDAVNEITTARVRCGVPVRDIDDFPLS